LVGVLMLLGMGALGLRLWWIQVAHGEVWTSQLRGSSQATVRIPSVRGEIKDRNGVTLVQNRASYEVDFYLPEMVKGYRERFGPPPLKEYRTSKKRWTNICAVNPVCVICARMPRERSKVSLRKILHNKAPTFSSLSICAFRRLQRKRCAW